MFTQRVIINPATALKEDAALVFAQRLTAVALKRTTGASAYKCNKWARRAVPTGWARLMRDDMRQLIKDIQCPLNES